MKKTTIAILIMSALLFCSCSHNPAGVTIGKKLSIGTPEYGDLTYLNGFAIVDCARENSEWQIDINDNEGLSFDPTTNTLKGVKSIRRRIGKQVTGYLNDLAASSPDAVTEYLKGDVMFSAMPSNSAAVVTSKQDKGPDITTASEVATEAISKARQVAFCPTGNCSAKGQASNGSISYQRKLAVNLLAFAPEDKIPTDTDVTAKENLGHFITRMDELREKKKTTTKIRIESYTIKDKALVALRFVCPKSGGETGWEDVDCVDCYDIEFDD